MMMKVLAVSCLTAVVAAATEGPCDIFDVSFHAASRLRRLQRAGGFPQGAAQLRAATAAARDDARTRSDAGRAKHVPSTNHTPANPASQRLWNT